MKVRKSKGLIFRRMDNVNAIQKKLLIHNTFFITHLPINLYLFLSFAKEKIKAKQKIYIDNTFIIFLVLPGRNSKITEMHFKGTLF